MNPHWSTRGLRPRHHQRFQDQRLSFEPRLALSLGASRAEIVALTAIQRICGLHFFAIYFLADFDSGVALGHSQYHCGIALASVLRLIPSGEVRIFRGSSCKSRTKQHYAETNKAENQPRHLLHHQISTNSVDDSYSAVSTHCSITSCVAP